MVEVGAVDCLLVGVERDVAVDAAPKTHTVNRDDILCLAFYVAYVERELAFLHRSAVAEEASLCTALLPISNRSTVAVDNLVGCHHLIIYIGSFSTVDVADVERSENLLLLVESYVLVLLRLER